MMATILCIVICYAPVHCYNRVSCVMGVKESKVTYFDGSYYQGEVNSSGREHGQGCIHYANGDFLKGTFVDGDCTNASVQKKNG